jgi:hypothetical protein
MAASGALARRPPLAQNYRRAIGQRFDVMHYSIWGFPIAIALGGVALRVANAFPDFSRLRSGLFLLAFLIALLATLGFAHDRGWLGGAVSVLRRQRRRKALARVEMRRNDEASSRQTGATVQAPRPAGPAGPVPVLQKQSQDASSDKISTTGVPAVASPIKPPDD